MRDFLRPALLLCVLFGTVATDAATPPTDLSALREARRQALDRPRRIIFNNDGNEPVYKSEDNSPEKFLACLAHAIEVYAHPFFAANAQALRLVAGTITNAYADSVAWEQDPAGWRFKVADVLRFAGVEMTMAVALRCGGFEHLRRVSPAIRDFAWQRQHTFQGEPH